MDKSSEQDFFAPGLFEESSPDNECCEITVLNRSKTYHVSKKSICSLVPYFSKIFCCDLLESNENTVILDLDEDSFSSILNWVDSKPFIIKISNVLLLMDTADYLMIDKLRDQFLQYFRQNFTVEHIPLALESANLCVGPLNYQVINRFIEIHFLRIINTRIFLEYPFETIDYIFKLNLQIDSEYQIFESIAKWIGYAPGSRKEHIFPLLKCIRWCHVNENDLQQINKHAMFTFRNEYESVMCLPDKCKNNCGPNRAKGDSLILIYKVDDQTIGMNVLDSFSAVESNCGHFQLSEDLCIHVCTFAQCSEIIFNSGREGIHVDWNRKKFRYLDMIGSDNSYYGQIYRSIIHFQPSESEKWLYLLRKGCTPVPDSDYRKFTSAMLESEGRFNGVFFTRENLLAFSSASQSTFWYYQSHSAELPIHSCLNKNELFVINGMNHTYYNLKTLSSTKVEFPVIRAADRDTLDSEFKFDDLQLTCLGSKLYLINTKSKNIHLFDVNSQKWKFFGKIDCPLKLITLTTSYLPMMAMK